MSKAADLSSVCRVFSTVRRGPKKGAWEGVGTFISPHHVLTALHCVRDATHIEVVSVDGRMTQARTLKPVAQDTAMDVAIINLLAPIGRNVSKMPRGEYQNPALCMLKTIFDNKASVHSVDSSSFFEGNQQDQTNSPIIDFSTTITVGPGYSGSPIIGRDGETVISVTVQYVMEEQQHLVKILNGLQQVSGLKALGALPLINFRGANPRLFHDWAQKSAAQLNIA